MKLFARLELQGSNFETQTSNELKADNVPSVSVAEQIVPHTGEDFSKRVQLEFLSCTESGTLESFELVQKLKTLPYLKSSKLFVLNSSV